MRLPIASRRSAANDATRAVKPNRTDTYLYLCPIEQSDLARESTAFDPRAVVDEPNEASASEPRQANVSGMPKPRMRGKRIQRCKGLCGKREHASEGPLELHERPPAPKTHPFLA